MEGVDVWPLVTGEASTIRDHIITGFHDWAAVRDKEWNYQVRFEDPEAEPRLYHHTEDPGEQRNVAAEHPDVVAKQRGRLEALLGQSLPAKLPDTTHPSAGPYVTRFDRLFESGKIKLPE